ISQPQGARLPRRPRNEVYVSGSYVGWKRLRTTIEAKFVNAREELNFGGPNFDIEDYSFVNIAAEYEVNAHLSIFGRIDNLKNEHYAEGFGFPGLGRASPGGVKLRFSFVRCHRCDFSLQATLLTPQPVSETVGEPLRVYTNTLNISDKKLAVLGAGKLGGILLRAYLKQGLFVAKRVTATVKHGEEAAALAK